MSKETLGIVRRMDDLGRVVIPREIRRQLNLKENDPLELTILSGSNHKLGVYITKYSPVAAITDYAEAYARSLSEVAECPCIITDTERVVAVGPEHFDKMYLDQKIGSFIENKIAKDSSEVYTRSDAVTLDLFYDNKFAINARSYAIGVIKCGGEIAGAVCLWHAYRAFGDMEKGMVNTAANYIGRMLEE